MKNLQKGVSVFLALVAILVFTAPGRAEDAVFKTLAEIETLVYGQEAPGSGLVARLAQVEKDLFGRELPGSLAERQQSLLAFLKEGSAGQPSFLFKIGVAEWAVFQGVHPGQPASTRIGNMESQLEGTSQEGKPLAMRLERLTGMLLPEPVSGVPVEVPAQTIFKVEIADALAAKTAKAGDPFRMRLAGDLAVGDRLVAPKGSLVLGHVDSVKPPRSFGRKAEIRLAFDRLVPLGPEPVTVLIGERAKAAAKSDASVVAAGTSVLGLFLLGPVGLAGGLLIRGDSAVIEEGTPFYLETAALSTVSSYPVPPSLRGMLTPVEIKEIPPVSGDARGGSKP